ncbi:MAG: hypothetical protein DK305_000781 [Chloroflexi bacterium]|jgi:alkylation response protein AidB-like acyl-CoA dehydrogenase|nr:MAG: hypothetical protein DK305_000781 [Chloroflexota bacterium]
MNWLDTAEQKKFRIKVKDFLDNYIPNYYKNITPNRLAEGHTGGWQYDYKVGSNEAKEAALDWVTNLAKHKWVAPHWPIEYGGAGLSPMEQFILRSEFAWNNVPPVAGPGVNMLGPTIVLHGTEEQKKELLPDILSGEITWAQGYSEPGAGSDLASLTTRAIKDGDDYVVNGQKIWTSSAHKADWIFILVRTDNDAPKHRGISFIYTNIKQEGIEVRPIISGGWEHATNETFYQDVRVPIKQRIGDENRGWYVAMTLLDHERSNVSGMIEKKKTLDSLIKFLKIKNCRYVKSLSFSSYSRQVVDRYIECEVGFNFSLRIISMQDSGLIPNQEASTAKLYNSELTQKIDNTGMKVFGLYSNLWDPNDIRSPMHASFTQKYVHHISATIAGGTSEIQRNIIATRGLGLPRG